MCNQTKTSARPAGSEAMMIGGVGGLVIGAGLIAAVLASLRAGEPHILEMVYMAGLASLVAGVVLLCDSAKIWRLDRLEKLTQAESSTVVVDDGDIVHLDKRRI